MAIKVLDKHTANLIAAGEVVERPASVVKELIENAIDAGATRIAIELKKGGMSYIRVTDNGCGIPAAEVKTAFLRHATSKISTGGDLGHICTLGFRGEALASIAAVAHVEVLTRTADETAGTALVLEGGDLVEETEAGCPAGTTMIVRSLFFNTPARMKFLKSDAAETGHVTDLVGKCILCHPEISFQYINGGKTVLQSPGDGDLLAAVHTVLGREYAQNMLPVHLEEEHITITGYVGSFSLARRDRRHQLFFLNGRTIISRTLSAAVGEGYKNAMMVGKFPVCVLHITTAPSFVDVNVHPAKLEVRFSDDKKMYNAVCWAVRDAISATKHIPEIKRDPGNQPPVQVEIPLIARRPAPKPKQPVIREPEQEPPYIPSAVAGYQTPPAMLQENTDGHFQAAANPEPPQPEQTPEPQPEQTENTPQAGIDFTVAGQVFGTYILVQQGDELLLIDQHAAHERLCFEELLDEYHSRQVSSQLMLLPLTLRLDPLDFQTICAHLALFSAIGFDIGEFGTDQIIVRAVPAPLDDGEIQDIIGELASLLRDHAQDADGLLAERALHTVACKRALKGNHALTKPEMERLCERVLALAGINTCPHGRPIMVKMTKSELERQFKRVV